MPLQERPSKPLITYSRVGTRPLPLTGVQFLRVPSAASNLSVGRLATDKADDQTGFVASSQSAPDSSLSLCDSDSSHKAPEECNADDPIIDDPVPVPSSSASTTRRSSRSPGSPKPLSVLRKTLRLPKGFPLSEPRIAPQISEHNKKGGGFSTSELSVLPRPRRRRSEVPLSSQRSGILQIRKGPSPNVESVRSSCTDDKPSLATSIGLDIVIHGHAGDTEASVLVSKKTTRHISFRDRLVFAQLSSIHAPRCEQSPISLSDDSQGEDYDIQLLDSEYDSLNHDDYMAVPTRRHTEQSAICDVLPGNLPRTCLGTSQLIGVDDDIFDSETPNTSI